MNRPKDILIVANFTAGKDEKLNNGFNYLAEMLNDDGRFKAELATSSFSHVNKAQRQDGSPFSGGGEDTVTYVYEPGYKKNVSLKRFYSHCIFGRNVTGYLKKRDKPDAIYCAVPSLSAARACIGYGREAGVPVVLDVQDLWPEAFQMVVPSQALGKLLFFPFKRAADEIYSRADRVVAVSELYGERVQKVRSGKDEPLIVYLGTDFAAFDRVPPGERASAGRCRAVYAGTVGYSYDMHTLIDGFKLADPNDSKFDFVVLGDGPMLKSVKEYAEKQGVRVNFRGRVPYEDAVAVLKSADVGINSIAKGSAVSIINKHGDYAAAGLPVISTQEGGGYRELLDRYEAGFTFPAGDARGIAEGLKCLHGAPAKGKAMGENNRKMGEALFNREKTYRKIVELLLEI